MEKLYINPPPQITEIDLERIAEYFEHDYMNSPNPKKLQQSLIFYIIYYFCRHGRENLYPMKKDTFRLIVDPDGTEYLIQDQDEWIKIMVQMTMIKQMMERCTPMIVSFINFQNKEK